MINFDVISISSFCLFFQCILGQWRRVCLIRKDTSSSQTIDLPPLHYTILYYTFPLTPCPFGLTSNLSHRDRHHYNQYYHHHTMLSTPSSKWASNSTSWSGTPRGCVSRKLAGYQFSATANFTSCQHSMPPSSPSNPTLGKLETWSNDWNPKCFARMGCYQIYWDKF